MSDLVVTVPAREWEAWVSEGDAAGSVASGQEYVFSIPTRPLRLERGDRVYVVAGDRLRGYAPLVRLDRHNGQWLLVRSGGAVAITIAGTIRGFRGYRYRFWSREDEVPFPEWRTL